VAGTEKGVRLVEAGAPCGGDYDHRPGGDGHVVSGSLPSSEALLIWRWGMGGRRCKSSTTHVGLGVASLQKPDPVCPLDHHVHIHTVLDSVSSSFVLLARQPTVVWYHCQKPVSRHVGTPLVMSIDGTLKVAYEKKSPGPGIKKSRGTAAGEA